MYCSSDSHACEIFRMHVKIIRKLFPIRVNFFFTHVKQFFLACEILSCMWNFFSQIWNNFVVSEIFSRMWNNFVLHGTFFTFDRDNLVMHDCGIFLCTWTLCHVCENFFSHMGNSFVMHALTSARQTQSTQELIPNDCGNVPYCHQV